MKLKTKGKYELPMLRFSPNAWAKLRFMRDQGKTEVGGFGISREDDPLYIEDFVTVKQKCTYATVEFDDIAVADFTEDMVEAGYQPWQVLRIWIHTHPMDSPLPSATDESTFEDAFGECSWSIMFILAKNDSTYCRLKLNESIEVEMEIGVEIDFDSYDLKAGSRKEWEKEYKKNVEKEESDYSKWYTSGKDRKFPGHNYGDPFPTTNDNRRSIVPVRSLNARKLPDVYSREPVDSYSLFDIADDYSDWEWEELDESAEPEKKDEYLEGSMLSMLRDLDPSERIQLEKYMRDIGKEE